ncbi:MAG: hypothetical protein OQK82_01955, partial [Candidatus Pacearchaeota archaeon]|nr:hypothetical protein [Candidatus Pacearchaeota archaeon]
MLILSNLSLLVSAEKVNSPAGVEYNSDLLRVFDDESYVNDLMNEKNFIGLKIIENQTWIRVTVVLKDNSGIIVEGNKSQRAELVNQKVEWTKKEAERFLKIFSNEEYIKNARITSGGFGGLISEEGLNFLLNSTEVDYISWSQYKLENILEESVELILV